MNNPSAYFPVVAEARYGSRPAHTRLAVEFVVTEPAVEVFAGVRANDGRASRSRATA